MRSVHRHSSSSLFVYRRYWIAVAVAAMAFTALPPAAFAEASARDIIAASIVKIDAERGTLTLRHAPIAHLHMPGGTTVFRYVDSRIIIGRRDGDSVLFRADRVDLTLVVTMMVPVATPR